MIEDDTKEIHEQKIIPDGYPELIFHFGDPYEINISGDWVRQERSLLAGQISSFFHLKNTGRSRMFAVKLQPWTVNAIFGMEASDLSEKVVSLSPHEIPFLKALAYIATGTGHFKDKCLEIGEVLRSQDFEFSPQLVDVIEDIVDRNGLVSVQELCDKHQVNERTLERQFKLHVGLSPKRYCRIIRHAYVFKVVQEKPDNWAQVAYKAGYYDQTHFIKNFQEFTGEDPSRYGFDEENMANFFMK